MKLREASQFKPRLSSRGRDAWYQDGFIQADIDYDPDFEWVLILTWSSQDEGKGNSARALEWLGNKFKQIVVQDPGKPGESSFTFWEHMFRKGLVQRVISDRDEVIFENELIETPEMRKGYVAEVTGQFRVTDAMRQSARGQSSQVIVEMPPEVFLRLTTTDVDSITSDSHSLVKYNRWSKMGQDERYREWYNKNRPDPEGREHWGSTQHPFLIIEINMGSNGHIVGRVVGHEGRHRAAALIKAGGKSYPVALQLRSRDDSIKIPGMPSYDDTKWWLSKDQMPVAVKSQFSQEWVSTRDWKIIANQPLRSAKRD